MQPRSRSSSTVARPVAPAATKAQRPVEKPVDFTFHCPDAKCVSVAGSFNNWDTKRHPLKREGDAWKATLWLPPGRYEYRFVSDGRWTSDPNCKETSANPYGEANSVIKV
jgi:1,4-alpha-glucan branching enzyme